MSRVDLFTVSAEQLRSELAGDLSRGGYVYRTDEGGERYFDKYLVLSRPGLISRSARLLAELLPADCARIAVTGIAAAVLAGAVSHETGVPLLLGLDTDDGGMRFGGEAFSRIRAVLLEDVTFTGQRALGGVKALSQAGAEVMGVVCLLDREAGAARVLGVEGYPLRALFTESQLLGG